MYVIGTVIGLTPDLMMDVYLGSLFHNIGDVGGGGGGGHPTWYIGVSIGVTIVATTAITWEVKRILKKVHVRAAPCRCRSLPCRRA